MGGEVKRNLIALIFGILGVLLALGAWHLYIDHLNHHATVQFIIDVQRAQQRAQSPASPPVAVAPEPTK